MINDKATINNILTQLRDYGYIDILEKEDNHFRFKLRNQETKEQKNILIKKLMQLNDNIEWHLVGFSDNYVFYDYSIIEEIIDEPNYSVFDKKEYSFMRVKGRIGNDSGITLIFNDVLLKSLNYDVYYDVCQCLEFDNEKDDRISYFSNIGGALNHKIILRTFKGDEYNEKKSWCIVERTREELDEIFSFY